MCARAPGFSLTTSHPEPLHESLFSPSFPYSQPALQAIPVAHPTPTSQSCSPTSGPCGLAVTSWLCFFLAGILGKSPNLSDLAFSCPWDGDNDPSAQDWGGAVWVCPRAMFFTLHTYSLCSFLVSMLQFNKTVY